MSLIYSFLFTFCHSDVLTAEVLNNLGVFLKHEKRYYEAVSCYTESLEIRR